MKALSLTLAIALATTALTFVPTASAIDEITCDDRTCLVSIETYVCVTTPCDGVVICLAHGKVCSNRLLP